MALSTLLEDPLLEVLSHLTPPELLQCRLVCKRWSELALHPWLWAKKVVIFPRDCLTNCSNKCSTSMRQIAAILQLVPCLGLLGISDFDQLAEDVVGLLLSTRCAVSELIIHSSASHATLVAATLARQASLGCLKKVRLTVYAAKESNPGGLCGLLLQLVQMHGLETLKLHYSSDGTVLPALLGADQVDALPTSSLRQLMYFSNSFALDPYLHLLLMRHAATLEDVNIGVEGPQLAPLLSTMANLRNLRCVPLEGMSALLQCPSLKSLQVFILAVPHLSLHLHAAKDYLNAAMAQLEELRLMYSGPEESDDAVDLMLCLAGTGGAAPALLKFGFMQSSESTSARLQRHLASVLHRLPNLRHLEMHSAPTGDLLAALDGTVLPNLVQLYHRCPVEFECPHEWAHSKEVERLLRKYPRLHIVACGKTQLGDCDFCEKHKCHAIPHGPKCVISCHDPKSCMEPFCCDDYLHKIHISLKSSEASRPTAPEPSE